MRGNQDGSTLISILLAILLITVMMTTLYATSLSSITGVAQTVLKTQALMNARSGLQETYLKLKNDWNTNNAQIVSQGISPTAAAQLLSQFAATEAAALTADQGAYAVTVTAGANDLSSASSASGLFQDMNISVTGEVGTSVKTLNDTVVISGTISALNYAVYTPGNIVLAGAPQIHGSVYVGTSMYIDQNPWIGNPNSDVPIGSTQGYSYVQLLDSTYFAYPSDNSNQLRVALAPFFREPIYDLPNDTSLKPMITGTLTVAKSIDQFNGVSDKNYFGDAGDPNVSNGQNYLLYNNTDPNPIWTTPETMASSALSSVLLGNPQWNAFSPVSSKSVADYVNQAMTAANSLPTAVFERGRGYGSNSWTETPATSSASYAISLPTSFPADNNRHGDNGRGNGGQDNGYGNGGQDNGRGNGGQDNGYGNGGHDNGRGNRGRTGDGAAQTYTLAEDPNISSVQYDSSSNTLLVPPQGLSQPLYVNGNLAVTRYASDDYSTNVIAYSQPIYVNGSLLIRGDMEPQNVEGKAMQGGIFVTGQTTIANVPAGDTSRLEIYSIGSMGVTVIAEGNQGLGNESPTVLNAFLSSASNAYVGGNTGVYQINGGLQAQNVVLTATEGDQMVVSEEDGPTYVKWTGGQYPRLVINYDGSYVTNPLTGTSSVADLHVQPLPQPTLTQ